MTGLNHDLLSGSGSKHDGRSGKMASRWWMNGTGQAGRFPVDRTGESLLLLQKFLFFHS